MVSFRGDPALKAQYLSRLRAHIDADELVIGPTAWQNGKGSALGCTIHAVDTDLYAQTLGYPVPLAALLDELVRWLAGETEVARLFAIRWLEETPVGSDLSATPTALAIDLLSDPTLAAAALANAAVERSLTAVLALHRRELVGEVLPREIWAAARKAAVAASDETTEAEAREAGHVIEAAAWPASRARTLLMDMLRGRANLEGTLIRAEFGWSDADERRGSEIMREISTELAPRRARGEVTDVKATFLEREPEFGRRFFEQNARILAGLRALAQGFAQNVLARLRAGS